MDTCEEKKKLLLEMIAYATIDGQLSKKGYDFLFLIANELNFEKGGFIDLLGQELPSLSGNMKLIRIKQFYKLVVFFQNDGVLYKQDPELIIHIAISMGLDIEAIKVLLKKVKNSPNSVISDDVLLNIFQDE
ncbi:excinuclease ABC subunit B [Flavobacterium glycines]|nr:excinuclease ABC subunit B [Flavobacterium glycines]OCB74759.1 excinuclease ABC subunit B [Flavobacterium glycines]